MSITRKAIALVCALVLSTSMFLVACGPTATTDPSEMKLVEDGVLTVGSDCDYPPFIELDGTQPAGFEYDLLEALAEDMGLTLNYLEPQNFDTLVAQVDAGVKMDLACSSITINPERAETIDFSDPYFDANQACVVMANSTYTKATDLEGLTVGAQAGTTGLEWANEHIPGITMKPFNQASEGMQALQAGQIEAMFFDAPSADFQVNNNFEGMKIIEVIPTGEEYGFAISKDNPALKAAINKSLQNLIDNGTYERIFKEYFPNLELSIG